MPYEHRTQPLPPFTSFVLRLLRRAALVGSVLGVALGIGAVGYRLTEHMPWIDALLNAAMILTGMGQVSILQTTAGKLFAVVYALFSGIVFLTSAALIFGPVVHRALHHFHLDITDESPEKPEASAKQPPNT